MDTIQMIGACMRNQLPWNAVERQRALREAGCLAPRDFEPTGRYGQSLALDQADQPPVGSFH